MSDSVAQDQILAIVQRIERVEEEVKELNKDKSEIYAEAKGNGFDVKALKLVIAKRRMGLNERMELEAIVELYEAALGMYPGDTGTRFATRAPAPETDADGVIIEPYSAPVDSSPAVVERATNGPPAGLHDAGEAAYTPTVEASPAEIQAAVDADVEAQELIEIDAANDTHGRAPNNDEASPEVGPQAEASPAGTGTGTLVDRGARFDGEAVSTDLPTLSPAGEVAAGKSDEAEGVSPLASSAPLNHYELDTADLDRSRVLLANCIECRARIYDGDEHYLTGPDHDQFECAACGTATRAAPPKLKMNPEFFEPPHPLCRRKEFCGGNSNLGLCEECKAAADQHLEAAAE